METPCETPTIRSTLSLLPRPRHGTTSPTILILLRVTRRELTLCEHRAGDPSSVAPIFSPDSQTIFFQSDRHGKPAIYEIHVEKLVEATEE